MTTLQYMQRLNEIVSNFANIAWGLPLVILLIGGGLYLLILSRFTAFRYLYHSLELLRGKHKEESAEGEITHFQALSTALSSTIGMGNIAGVAVAISIGGPGAIFWMWISGIIGMSTKFFTGSLAIMYRGRDSNGDIQGGPMYFIKSGLSKKWHWLASFFAVCGLVGALPVFNVNQLTQAVRDIILVPNGLYQGVMTDAIFGFVLIILAAIVIFGGITRISRTTEKLVPFMVLLYFFAVSYILITHYDRVPHYLWLIITDAFNADSYTGDSLYGGAIGGLILLGIRRGAFSNEAGIGTAPMAHGASMTNEPIKEGLVSMLGPMIDTLIVCTLTALAILVTDAWELKDIDGVSLTAHAFTLAAPDIGSYILLLCIAVFSISSLFSFSYYGTKCLSFLIGAEHKHWYRYFYLLSILLGAVTSLDLMINLIDGFYALMAIPTMIATLILAPKVMREARIYFNRL